MPESVTSKPVSAGPRVGLFVTCLVDLMRPSVGFAAVKLLEQAGCRVEVPAVQTCCGQPAFNSGDFPHARAIAEQVIRAFEGYDYVVAPSGSCMGMIKVHYARLFEGDDAWLARAGALAERSHELLSFLTDVLRVRQLPDRCATTVTYHDSCSGLRELGVHSQPRKLLSALPDVRLIQRADEAVCCGFGGLFSVKFPELSVKMASDKASAVEASGAEMLVGGDLGCLVNIAGRLRRQGSAVRVFHLAELLAGMTDGPGIGEEGT
jgi:L-lactate dehydrogenase complex protein LldE